MCAVPSVAVLRRSGSRDVVDVLRFDGLQWVSYGSFKQATATGSAADLVNGRSSHRLLHAVLQI